MPLQVVADASFVERAGRSNEQVRDGSVFAGASLLLPWGWMQVNVARFSPGDFPALNDPLHDRETAFGAGEYDFGAVRVFAGVETFRANLDPDLGCRVRPRCRAPPATRGFGGIGCDSAGHIRGHRRVEEGDRNRSGIGDNGLDAESDTGARFRRMAGALRAGHGLHSIHPSRQRGSPVRRVLMPRTISRRRCS